MAKWIDLIGTSLTNFKLGLTGVLLKNDSGNLAVRNNADSADAEITTAKLNNSGDSITLNSDATNSGADWSLSFNRPTAGMTADVALTFPPTVGSPNQVLSTDGSSGVLTWVTTSGSNNDRLAVDTTSLAFGSSTTVPMFSLPANAVISSIETIVDTTFDGTPSLSVGISGDTSKYVPSTLVDLTASAKSSFTVTPNEQANGSSENLEIAYSAGGATAGAARVLVYYSIPA